MPSPFPGTGPFVEGPDAETSWDLRELFVRVYDDGGYDYSLDYDRALEPPLAAGGEEFACEIPRRRAQ